MFVTEKIPLGLTSMIVCVGLVVTKVLDVSTAFKGFITDSSEIELKDILSELNSNELEKILNASRKAHDEKQEKY